MRLNVFQEKISECLAQSYLFNPTKVVYALLCHSKIKRDETECFSGKDIWVPGTQLPAQTSQSAVCIVIPKQDTNKTRWDWILFRKEFLRAWHPVTCSIQQSCACAIKPKQDKTIWDWMFVRKELLRAFHLVTCSIQAKVCVYYYTKAREGDI